MSLKFCFATCRDFETEMKAISQVEGMPPFKNVSVPLACENGSSPAADIRAPLQQFLQAGWEVHILGSGCLPRAFPEGPGQANLFLHPKDECAAWFVDPLLLERSRREGARLLLPGWLVDWKNHVERMGFDRKQAQSYFQRRAKRLVLIDTAVLPRGQKLLESFARFVNLPSEVFLAGLEHFVLNLKSIILQSELRDERQAFEKRFASAHGLFVDYGRMAQLLAELGRSETEAEALERSREVFHHLLAPRHLVYRPADPASPGESPEFAWSEVNDGFSLRFGSGGETFGTLDVWGLERPEWREHYANLGLALARVTSLAVAGARDRARSREVETALRESNERARSLVEGIPVGVYRTTADGQFLQANKALARMLSYPDTESLLLASSASLHVDARDREIWRSLMDANGFVDNFETRLRRFDGRIIWVKDTARAVRDARGQVLFYDGTLEDITRRKQTEAALFWVHQVDSAIAELSSKLLSPASIGDVSALVLERARRLTRSPFGLVGYIDEQTGALVPSAITREAWEEGEARDTLPAIHGGAGLWQWVLNQKKPLMTNSPYLDPRSSGTPAGHMAMARFLAVPAVIKENLQGVVAVANSDQDYEERELAVIQRLADLFAIAVNRMRTEEELRALSLVDDLTGLYNRRGFLTLARQQIKIAHRNKREMVLIYADLDDLKWINDNLGHDEGDRAIRDISLLLKDAFRESDIIARLGGDEFVALVIDVLSGRGESLVTRVQSKIDILNARTERGYYLSVSLGHSLYNPEQPLTIAELLSEADRMMYQNKMAKQNRA
jgi:diguanylate cyclase (GGDEF)-like protein/PAS domain S-box-containing protein